MDRENNSRYNNPSMGYRSDRRAAQTGASVRNTGRGMTGGRKTTFENQKNSTGRYALGSRSGAAAGSRYNSSSRRGASQAARRRKKRRGRFFACLFFVLLLTAACAGGGIFLYHGLKEKTSVPDIYVDLDTLDSPYAVMLDGVSGTVVGSKRAEEIIYPASMTKIMTVLVAVEELPDLDKTIQMSYDYYDALYAADASRAGFEPGEEAVIRDLLYGALLPSGAECCMELAIQTAGSETDFAELMNRRAQEIGLTQTHFVNCTGLHSEEQYTTPHEMAQILQEALKNKTFRTVFTTHSYTVQPTAVHPDGFTFQSTMFKNMQSDTVIGGEIKGGKTGFTQAAGHCLASMAEINGREYILVTAGWAENPRTDLYHINDAYLGYNAVGRSLTEANEKEG